MLSGWVWANKLFSPTVQHLPKPRLDRRKTCLLFPAILALLLLLLLTLTASALPAAEYDYEVFTTITSFPEPTCTTTVSHHQKKTKHVKVTRKKKKPRATHHPLHQLYHLVQITSSQAPLALETAPPFEILAPNGSLNETTITQPSTFSSQWNTVVSTPLIVVLVSICVLLALTAIVVCVILVRRRRSKLPPKRPSISQTPLFKHAKRADSNIDSHRILYMNSPPPCLPDISHSPFMNGSLIYANEDEGTHTYEFNKEWTGSTPLITPVDIPKTYASALAHSTSSVATPSPPRPIDDSWVMGYRAVGIVQYAPVRSDEIQIDVGVEVFVTNEYQDGWASGIDSVTQVHGVFPLACIKRISTGTESYKIRSNTYFFPF